MGQALQGRPDRLQLAIRAW